MTDDSPYRGAWPVGRRALLGGTAALTTAMLAGCGRMDDADDLPEPERLALIQALAAIAIPATETSGAGTLQTARWVDTALRQGMRGSEPKTLVALEASLTKACPSGDFMMAKPDARLKAVAALDNALPPFPKPDLPPWGVVKSLIFRAYYTSEAGASKELVYELVPGRFEPSRPVVPDTRAYSTDQNARNLA